MTSTQPFNARNGEVQQAIPVLDNDSYGLDDKNEPSMEKDDVSTKDLGPTSNDHNRGLGFLGPHHSKSIGNDDNVKILRPPIVWDEGMAGFLDSFGKRLRSVFSRRMVLSLLAGQLVSVAITCTSVVSTALAQRGFNAPTTQNFFLYFSLMCIYTPYTIYRYGWKGWARLIKKDGWKYFLLAACDVEGNFLAVKAYQYTTLLSCMLLDCWAIPVCMFFQWFWQRPKYHWTQFLGVFIVLIGLGVEVASDHLTDKDYPAVNMVKGDIFMLIGATFYGFTNATEEKFVRDSPLYEVVGQMGLWGTLINGAQASGLEWKNMKASTWDSMTIGLLVAYTSAMIILYTIAPILYRMASSTYYNLSILSSDFYGLLFGLFLYHYKPYFLYFISFPVTIIGLIVYFWSLPLETQGKLDVKAPNYVDVRQGGIQIGSAKAAGDVEEQVIVARV